MFKNRTVLKSVADLVTQAAQQTLVDLREGWLEQEPAFTDRLIANLQSKIDGKTINGIHWKAKTLTDRGAHAQESTFGADFLGVLTIDLQGLLITKGFFAQAKLIRRKRKYSDSGELDHLKEQCGKMLAVTPDSFVFLYSKRNIKIVPASSVAGTSSAQVRDLANRTIGQFFVEYLECFIGDPKLNAPSLDRFYALAEQYQIRKGVYLRASDHDGEPKAPSPRPLAQQQTIRTPLCSPMSRRSQPLLA